MVKFRFQDLKIWQLAIEIADELFDIADDFSKGAYINYTLQHFKERIKQYNEQEFKYNMFTIGM